MNLNLCIVCLIHKTTTVYNSGNVNWSSVCYCHILCNQLLYKQFENHIDVFENHNKIHTEVMWKINWLTDILLLNARRTKGHSKKHLLRLWTDLSPLLPVLKRMVLIQHIEVPCSECIFLTVGCRVVRPCTVEQSAQRSTSCPQPMY